MAHRAIQAQDILQVGIGAPRHPGLAHAPDRERAQDVVEPADRVGHPMVKVAPSVDVVSSGEAADGVRGLFTTPMVHIRTPSHHSLGDICG